MNDCQPPPDIIKQLFQRLSRGSNLILSENGPGGDRELYRSLQESQYVQACRDYFQKIGLRLVEGDNCFYFVPDEEISITQEEKLRRIVEQVTLLNFLTQHIEGFGEGVVFSAIDLASRCQNDPRSAKVFQQNACKGETVFERVESLLGKLSGRGFLEDQQSDRREFRVLSAVHYLMDFADRIVIRNEEEGTES
ncbi:hypothetical protein QEH59_14700 [Coraliomargarita sp. SDUM461004]|uniref:DUF4194 domain-containing protein n=1 Tax=Thalassobacterium sedimentorum TaxID=3041258 RepID=A0ABU1APK0_9BACT|nr:hypothetical protein [Coraliomargarita sp. SDUM461004]MDQ8195681.1 hypothetical protein [Coraliomargarita sp. SDUM461004]